MRRRLLILALLLGACGSRPKAVPHDRPPPAPLNDQAYAHYLRGQLAFFEGDFARAIPELERAREAAPQEAPITVALVSALHESGDRKAAISEILKAQERWPDSAQVWMKSGALYRGVSDHQRAAESYHRAIKRGANTQAVRLAYAAELVAIGKSKRAERQYRKLIAKAPGNAEAHYQLARLLDQAGMDKAAASHADKVVQLSPYDLRAWALRSMSLRKLGAVEEANEALRRPFDRSGGDARVSEQLFTELLDLGPKAHAHELVSILERDDLSIDTRIGLGHLQLRIGDFEGALEISRHIDGELASTAAIAELRARALRALGRNDEAAKQLRAIGDGEPGYVLTRAMLAELLADAGRFDEARALIDEVMGQHGDEASLVLARSSVEEKAGQIARAREILQEAIEKHPRAQRPLYALAELENRRGNLDAAIKAILPLVHANPRDSSALNYVGYALIQKPGARERATSLLQRALEISPDSAFILDSYGWLLLTLGDLEAAKGYLERAARLTPAEPEVVLHLAELRWRTGERKEAEALFRRAESLALTRQLRERIRRRRQNLGSKP